MARFKKYNSTKEVNVDVGAYLTDWDHKVSGPQKLVKDALRPYWRLDPVLEEFRIPGSKLRIDLINMRMRIAVEVSPQSTHGEFNKWMHKTVSGYVGAMRRDRGKETWIEDNGFVFVEVFDDDFPILKAGHVKQWMLDKYQITL